MKLKLLTLLITLFTASYSLAAETKLTCTSDAGEKFNLKISNDSAYLNQTNFLFKESALSFDEQQNAFTKYSDEDLDLFIPIQNAPGPIEGVVLYNSQTEQQIHLICL